MPNETSRSGQTPIPVKRRDHRFAGISKQGRIIATTTINFRLGEYQTRRQPNISGNAGKGITPDQRRKPSSKRAFFLARKTPTQHVSNDQAKHSVTKKF
jgi:hypothetical protein